MKINIKISTILIITFSLFIVNRSAAQGFSGLRNASPEKRAEFQSKMMKSKLDLNDGQVKKVQEINLKYAKLFEPILKSKEPSDKRIKLATGIQESKDKELQTVFNKDQFKTYKEFEEKLKSKMMARLKDAD
jgi:hypothetical protein